MKLQALASVAVLLCTGFVSAMPNQQWGDNCYKCEYKYDDCGKEYGGYDVSLPYIHPRSLPSMHIVLPPYLPSLPSCGITTNHQPSPNLPSPHFTPTLPYPNSQTFLPPSLQTNHAHQTNNGHPKILQLLLRVLRPMLPKTLLQGRRVP